jgi:hypothetical protein
MAETPGGSALQCTVEPLTIRLAASAGNQQAASPRGCIAKRHLHRISLMLLNPTVSSECGNISAHSGRVDPPVPAPHRQLQESGGADNQSSPDRDKRP